MDTKKFVKIAREESPYTSGKPLEVSDTLSAIMALNSGYPVLQEQLIKALGDSAISYNGRFNIVLSAGALLSLLVGIIDNFGDDEVRSEAAGDLTESFAEFVTRGPEDETSTFSEFVEWLESMSDEFGGPVD